LVSVWSRVAPPSVVERLQWIEKSIPFFAARVGNRNAHLHIDLRLLKPKIESVNRQTRSTLSRTDEKEREREGREGSKAKNSFASIVGAPLARLVSAEWRRENISNTFFLD
jgi:hypothetical protein